MNFILNLVVFIAVSMCFVACTKQGPNEKTGERFDDIIDNVKDGDPVFEEKGTAEKIGESLDNSNN